MDRKIVELLVVGRGLNYITKMLHVGKRRIKRLHRQALEYGYLREDGAAGPVALPPYPDPLFGNSVDLRIDRVSAADKLLEQYSGWIKERLEAGWHAVTVFEELPVKGISRSGFYRYLRKHKLNRSGEMYRAVFEIVHKPGETLILDWGKLRAAYNAETGRKGIVWAFVGVMGYSRKMMIRLVWSIDVTTTLGAIESMFRELGGVPTKITTDNPKCFSLEASLYEPLLNPVAEHFASHYGVVIECLPPGEPRKKGKVERMMPYVRRLYEAHGDNWEGLEESQDYINKKVAIANQRRHGTTLMRPDDIFNSQEAKALKALPALFYEIECYHEGTVREDGYVRYDGKYYSVDGRYAGKEVTVLANSKTVCIYNDLNLLEVHERITDPNRTKSTKLHHLRPWERAIEDGAMYRSRAEKLGPHVAELVDRILKHGQGFIDTHKIWGILSLDKRYDARRIDRACECAIGMDSYSYRAVIRLLEIEDFMRLEQNVQSLSAGAREGINAAQASHKFVRPLSVYEAQLSFPGSGNCESNHGIQAVGIQTRSNEYTANGMPLFPLQFAHKKAQEEK